MQSRRLQYLVSVVLLVCVAWTRASAQSGNTSTEADALVLRIKQTYASAPSLRVEAWYREMSSFGGGFRSFGNARPELTGETVRRVEICRRKPSEEWRIVTQEMIRHGGGGDGWTDGKTFVFDRQGGSRAGVTLLNRSTQEPLRIALPPVIFQQEMQDRLGYGLSKDPLVSGLLGLPQPGMGGRPVTPPGSLYGLIELRLDREDSPAIAGHLRLRGQTLRRGLVYLWVDPQTNLIARQITLDGFGGDYSETLYRNELRQLGQAEISADTAWPRLGLTKSGGVPRFTPFEELVKLAERASSVERETEPEPPTRIAQPAIPAPSTPTTPSFPNDDADQAEQPGETPTSAAELAAGQDSARSDKQAKTGQQLSAEQMEAIVLIEGDTGVGTGFVAKLRDRYFVVTNLHVIGGNASLKVKTIRGRNLAVGGFFGARGRDIAILRIEGDYQGPSLTLADDVFASVKIGDAVAVVGNRRGGGVATQVTGEVQGIGPDRVEVNAKFQPGNSGSPIVHLASGQVIGVASYSQTRELDEITDERPSAGGGVVGAEVKIKEQRWFGFRMDGTLDWQAIDLAVWRTQAKQIDEFAEDSRAIYHILQGFFETAQTRPRLRVLVERFDSRFVRTGGSGLGAAQEVREFFWSLRAEADVGVKELKAGNFYDFFQTCEYWESSIKAQLETRAELVRAIEQATKKSDSFISKLRR